MQRLLYSVELAGVEQLKWGLLLLDQIYNNALR